MNSQMIKEMLGIKADALVVLTNHKTGEVRIILGHNLVTDAGDIYYAQKACDEAPDNNFTSLYLATAGPVPVTKADDYDDFTVVDGSEKAVTGTYPKTDDDDPDNSEEAGENVVTWLFEYAAADGPFVDITHSFVAAAGAGIGSPILNSYEWGAAWSKDASTSAKIFDNLSMVGA